MMWAPLATSTKRPGAAGWRPCGPIREAQRPRTCRNRDQRQLILYSVAQYVAERQEQSARAGSSVIAQCDARDGPRYIVTTIDQLSPDLLADSARGWVGR
jgi:hypothetical protein